MDKEKLMEILKIALSRGGDFADIYIEKRFTNRVSCEDNKIEKIVSGEDVGAGIRIISGESNIYASTNKVTEVGLKELAKEIASNLPESEKMRKKNFSFSSNPKSSTGSRTNIIHKIEKPPSEVPIEEKIRLVLLGNRIAREVDRDKIKQVSISYADTTMDITIANLSLSSKYGVVNDNQVEEKRIYTTYLVSVVAQEGEIIQTGYEPLGGLVGFELFDKYDVKKIAREAAERAVKILFAQKAPSGEMTVVLTSTAGGTMIHEAIGHSLEADSVQKKVSPAYMGMLGKRVTSELITVVDDPTIPNYRGSFHFDDEGTPAQKTILLERGMLRNYLYDRFTAQKDGTKSTGNGRRESYHHQPIPRMSNTYILPGESQPEEIIRSVNKGFLVKKMGGGQVNTANGDFVFEVEEGYEIVNGKVGEMLRGATLIGNGPEVLNSIIMVGSDLGFNIGTCGKDGQWVPVTDGQPTIRIKKLTIGGTHMKSTLH
ncbi:TldD/PmbA family protein [bacterium]|nr:TldD/PmbA family protein [bacterium]